MKLQFNIRTEIILTLYYSHYFSELLYNYFNKLKYSEKKTIATTELLLLRFFEMEKLVNQIRFQNRTGFRDKSAINNPKLHPF